MRRVLLVLQAILACAGIAVCGYLLYTGLVAARLPAGCGAGSGCAAVLASRWGGTFGVPVSVPALATHLAALALIVPACSAHADRRVIARTVSILLATTMILAAAWFIGVQAVAIKSMCPWCLAAHAIGVALAIVLLLIPGDATSRRSSPMRSGAVAFGGLSVAIMIAGQYLVTYEPSGILRLPAGVDADTGPGTDRYLQLADGAWRLRVADLPRLGAADRPHLLVAQFDYCCPHCRRTHAYLLELLERHADALAVLVVPMPMNAACNAHVPETEPRFASSCDLARLALRVWHGNAMQFAAFDAWLFDSDAPRTADAARAEAERLVGADVLARSDDARVDAILADSADVYHESGAERIPVLWGVGLAPIVGRPESAAALEAIIARELLGASPSPETP